MKHQKSGCRLGALLLSAVMALSAGAVWQGFRAKAAGGEAPALSIETGPAVKGADGRFSFPELVLRVPDGAQVKSVTVQFSSAMEFLPSITSASELLAVSVAFFTVMAAVEYPAGELYPFDV